MTIGNGLLGPDAARARFQELQQRIDSFSPPSTAGAPSFANTLSGLQPADPAGFDVKGAGQLQSMADQAASKYGLNPQVFKNLIHTESGWNPNATSNKGAQGLAQLMPSTASSLGVTNPLDPAQSLEGGAKYLKQMLDTFGGDYTKAVAAYNAGPGAVQRANGIPPYQETVAYVRKILGNRNG